MAIIFVFSAFFAALLLSIYHAIPLPYPLLLGLIGFSVLTLQRGHSRRDLQAMISIGVRKSLIVLQIFVLIGFITAVWRACGTVSFIVYYGIQFMDPQYFLVSAFLLCCGVSFLLGTSFGTAGTIGVVLIVLAKSGQVDVNMAAGAIIAGAFFGDRCSPMSSSAYLVAAITNTELYINIKNMMKTAMIPFALSIAIYWWLSTGNPLAVQDTPIPAEILQSFDIGLVTLLPAVLILILAAFRVNVKTSMAISILAGLAIGMLAQHETGSDLLRYMLTGYTSKETGFFAGIIQGGGLYSMISPMLIVMISSAYAGIFAGTGLLSELETLIAKISTRVGLYATTILTSLVTAAFACNQTLAVILTHQFQAKIYERRQLSNYKLALDLENTAIVLATLIPWNIAGAVPAATLGVDSGFIVYAVYLYFLPLVNWLAEAIKINRAKVW